MSKWLLISDKYRKKVSSCSSCTACLNVHYSGNSISFCKKWASSNLATIHIPYVCNTKINDGKCKTCHLSTSHFMGAWFMYTTETHSTITQKHQHSWPNIQIFPSWYITHTYKDYENNSLKFILWQLANDFVSTVSGGIDSLWCRQS